MADQSCAIDASLFVALVPPGRSNRNFFGPALCKARSAWGQGYRRGPAKQSHKNCAVHSPTPATAVSVFNHQGRPPIVPTRDSRSRFGQAQAHSEFSAARPALADASCPQAIIAASWSAPRYPSWPAWRFADATRDLLGLMNRPISASKPSLPQAPQRKPGASATSANRAIGAGTLCVPALRGYLRATSLAVNDRANAHMPAPLRGNTLSIRTSSPLLPMQEPERPAEVTGDQLAIPAAQGSSARILI